MSSRKRSLGNAFEDDEVERSQSKRQKVNSNSIDPLLQLSQLSNSRRNSQLSQFSQLSRSGLSQNNKSKNNMKPQDKFKFLIKKYGMTISELTNSSTSTIKAHTIRLVPKKTCSN